MIPPTVHVRAFSQRAIASSRYVIFAEALRVSVSRDKTSLPIKLPFSYLYPLR